LIANQQRAMGNRAIDNGGWLMGNGQLAMADGGWLMGNGRWAIANRLSARSAFSHYPLAINGLPIARFADQPIARLPIADPSIGH